MGLLQEIRDGAVDSNTDVTTVLRKCLVLSSRLGHAGLKSWVEQELNGYKGKSENLPPYRLLHVQSLGYFVGGFGMQANNAPIPPRNVPELYREIVTTMPLVDPVAALVSLTQTEHDLMAPWPADLIAAMADKFYVGMNCVKAWRVVPRNAIVGVIDTIRNRILSFVLEIERQNPAAGEVTPGAPPAISQERVTQVFQTYIMGGTNIALGSAGVTQVANQVQPGDLESLKRHLAQHGVSNEDLKELERVVKEDETSSGSQRFGARVSKWIGKMTEKAMTGAWNVATSAASEILVAALRAYYGLPG